MRAYFTISIMVSLALFFTACGKSYKSYNCSCQLENPDGSTDTRAYGVQAVDIINANADCQDIESRLREDNARENFEQNVLCDLD